MSFKDILKRMLPGSPDASNMPNSESTTPVQERHSKYGYAEVPAEKIYACFNEIVTVQTPGFVQVQKGFLACAYNDQITHLLKFASGKGGVYSFRWGLSLSFVPHEWDPKRRFHRTLKSSRFDLFEEPSEFLVKDRFSDETWKYMASSLHGEECFRDELGMAWKNLEQVIKPWFAAATTLDWVLGKAREHMNRDWQGFRHSPDPALVYSFTLAKLQKLPEAKAILADLVKSSPEKYDFPELWNTLEEISSQEK